MVPDGSCQFCYQVCIPASAKGEKGKVRTGMLILRAQSKSCMNFSWAAMCPAPGTGKLQPEAQWVVFFLVHKFYQNTVTPIYLCIVYAAFSLQWHCSIVVTKTRWSENLKTLFFKKKFASPCREGKNGYLGTPHICHYSYFTDEEMEVHTDQVNGPRWHTDKWQS